MQKLGPNVNGKSAVETLDGRSRMKKKKFENTIDHNGGIFSGFNHSPKQRVYFHVRWVMLLIVIVWQKEILKTYWLYDHCDVGRG